MERIGIVLVHGIGEQGRFEHLSSEVRDLLAALDADPKLRCTVDTRSTRDSAVGAQEESWLAETGAPVRIDIRYDDDEGEEQQQSLDIHEVWWADLDDKATLWNRVKFWFWGLGMWRAKRFCRAYLPGAKSGMSRPKEPAGWMEVLWARAALFGFAVVFLLTAITFNLLNAVLRGLRLGRLGSDVLYRYVGDVKLYQDRGRPGQGPLEDRGLPRRVAIRRRMVAALVTAARGDYDRWYVLGHSLGSVVAFNGLMETAHALPNYLSEAALAGAQHFSKPDPKANPNDVKRMSPRRPVWISDDRCTLDRKKLFSGLRGFVTYGSPLDKFAFLWPQIVNVNNDKAVFAECFEWINIFDHSDPVAGRLDAFGDAFGEEPKNFAYKAHWLLLWSHKRYLKRGTNPDSALRRLLDWILDGGAPFPTPKCGWWSRWYRWKHPLLGVVYRMTMWLPLTVLLAVLLAVLALAVGFLPDWLVALAVNLRPDWLLALAANFLPDWLLALAANFLPDWLLADCGPLAIPCTAVGVLAVGVLATAGAIVLIAGILRIPIEALIDWHRHR